MSSVVQFVRYLSREIHHWSTNIDNFLFVNRKYENEYETALYISIVPILLTNIANCYYF